jgi:hypothetical protein
VFGKLGIDRPRQLAVMTYCLYSFLTRTSIPAIDFGQRKKREDRGRPAGAAEEQEGNG